MFRRPFSALPPGAAIAFEAAARLGSFKAAAHSLAITPAAVSQRIRALEEHLGLALFQRLNRAVRLTPAGCELAQAMFSAFATVEGSLDRLPVPARTLRVSAAPTLATKWLAARLDRFQAAYPGILVSLSASNEMIDPGQDPSIDVALRYGPGPYPGVHAEKLLTNRLCVCAAPEVAEGLSSAADIAGQVLLRSAPPLAAATQQTPWAAWLAKAALPPAAERGPMFSNSQMAIEAAALGRGLALVPELLVADDVRTGRLAKPFSLTLDDPFSFWFVCGAERADSVALATFRRWLLREIAATLHPSGV